VTIVLLTSVERDADLWGAIQMGAHGYLPKQIGIEGLCRALRGTLQGEAAITRAAATRLFKAYTRQNGDGGGDCCPHEELSPREQEVLLCLAAGVTNKEMAWTLGISEHTVKSHLKHIMTKLRLQNRTQAATYAYRYQQCLNGVSSCGRGACYALGVNG
jgi:DNA-binding NarL/FixJ family response regulator